MIKIFKTNKFHKINRSFIALVLCSAMCISLTLSADAAKSVSQLTNDKNKAETELTNLQAELTELMVSISSLESEIAEMNQEIADTEEQIQDAQETIDAQYASMKVRMQYMYEKGDDDDIFTILVTSGSITDFLNRVEYANTIYQYDRTLLDNYQAMLEELQAMRNGLQEEKRLLKQQENQLAAQKKSLNTTIANKKNQIKNFDKQIAAAQAAAQRQIASGATSSSSSSSSGTVNANAGANLGTGINPAHTTSVSGDAVVAYAKSYVGTHYVWGGNTLGCTDWSDGVGTDCSGFVQGVYKNFGLLQSGRQTSATLANVGQAVSVDCIQPGDIVCWNGHVAIYAGGGVVVEAQNKRNGVTCNRSLKSIHGGNIVAIRRII